MGDHTILKEKTMKKTTKQKIDSMLFALKNVLGARDHATEKRKEEGRESPEYNQRITDEALKQEGAERYAVMLRIWEDDMTREQRQEFKDLEERI